MRIGTRSESTMSRVGWRVTSAASDQLSQRIAVDFPRIDGAPQRARPIGLASVAALPAARAQRLRWVQLDVETAVDHLQVGQPRGGQYELRGVDVARRHCFGSPER